MKEKRPPARENPEGLPVGGQVPTGGDAPRVRVAVTAVGLVTPLGVGLHANARALREGRSAIVEVEDFDVSGTRCKTAGRIAPERLGEVAGRSRRHRTLHPASLAMLLAIEEASGRDAGFDAPDLAVFGTTSGGMSFGQRFLRSILGEGKVPDGAARLVLNYPAQKPCIDALGSMGWLPPLQVVANACASGANALGLAMQAIRTGAARRVVCGGYDMVSEMVFAGFDSLQASTPGVCRPFDRARDGLVLGEGAAVFFLEEWGEAERRGAEVMAELAGYGVSTDNYHLTQPHPSGVGPRMAMERALADAGVAPEAIGYVNAHGTATPFNDATEGLAIQEIFGAGGVPVSSTKGAMGHSLGAAGAVEAAFSVLALREGFLPPSLHFEEGDPELCLDIVSGAPREVSPGCVLSNSFGFGGTNASLVFACGREAVPVVAPPPGARRELHVLGIGAVTAFGSGIESVERALASRVVPSPAPLERPHSSDGWLHLPVLAGAADSVARERRLRRSSPISHFACAAALQALEECGVDLSLPLGGRIAAILCVSTGDVQYTRKFFTQIVEEGAAAASPMLFPETVYNAPASHVAAMLGMDAETYTLVGDAAAAIGGLRLARTLLASRRDLEHVLVVAAEEMDWVMAEAYAAFGVEVASWGHPDGVVFSEGAVAMLLGRDGGGCRVELPDSGGVYRGGCEARALLDRAWSACASGADAAVNAANGTWIDACESDAANRARPPMRRIDFKPLAGEAVGMSGLMQAALAAREVLAGRASSVCACVPGMSGMVDGARLTRN